MVFCTGELPYMFAPHVFESHVSDIEVDGKHVKLDIWDTVGSEEYDRVRALAYPDADVILICFGIDNPDSLDHVHEKWIPEAMHLCPGRPIILAGCKKDLRHDPKVIEWLGKSSKHPVTHPEGMAVAQKINAVQYLECAAKQNEGVNEVFECAARTALLTRKDEKARPKCIIS
ncbi:small GTPase-binding protein [Calocera cornea HHB12733]|uniref:Small GTPase-binding protein n=1 Tax=Calocera cornea HHB12733 TaxID=1353952 RepID=A0A165HK05_9BASI|nr:small GTPase-binding protein [Calocera cornea HHB12733]